MITREEYNDYKGKDEKAVMTADNAIAICFHCMKNIKTNHTRWQLEKITQQKNSLRNKVYYTLYFHHDCMLEIAGDKYDIEEHKPDPFEPF